MSYDLVFWKGRTAGDPREVWARLAGDQSVQHLALLGRDEVVRAFEAQFGSDLRVGATSIDGRGFEVAVEAGARYLHVTCSWSLLDDLEGASVLAAVREAGCERLGCTVFNPQTGRHRDPPTGRADAPDARSEVPWPGPLLEDAVRKGILIAAVEEKRVREAKFKVADEAALERWPRLVRHLLAHPSAATIESLHFDVTMPEREASEAAVQAVAEGPHARHLKRLYINRYDDPVFASLALGNLGAVLAAAPDLGELDVSAHTLRLEPIRHAGLRSFTVRSPTLGRSHLQALGGSTFPALHTLFLRFGAPGRPGSVDADMLVEALAPERVPCLRSVSLSCIANAPTVVAALVGSNVLGRLRIHIDPIDERTARALLDAKEASGAPHALHVSDVSCSDEAAAALHAVFGPDVGVRPKGATPAAKPAPVQAAAPVRKGIEVGDRVDHAKFGAGSVRAIEADKAEVVFDDGSERKLMTRFLKPVT
jgi:hypothetical protein